MPIISQEKWDANYNRILDVAKQLFYDNGYTKTSINEIVKISKISKGGFYTYFESKQDLCFAIINANDESIINYGVALDKTLPPKEQLSTYIRYRLERFYVEKNREMAKYTSEFWATIKKTEKQEVYLNERVTLFFEDINTVIVEGQRIGQFSTEIDINSMIHILVSTIDGLIFMDTVLDQRITALIIDNTIKVFIGYLENK